MGKVVKHNTVGVDYIPTRVISDTSLVPTRIQEGINRVKLPNNPGADFRYLDKKIDDETRRAIAEELSLQEQIDILNDKSFSVKDIVNTFSEVLAYDRSFLIDKDVIEVLKDETRNGATSFYRYSTDTDTFTCIGSSGPYYDITTIDTMIGDLQNQLDYLGEKSTIKDVVLTPQDLPLDTSTFSEGDIIIVLRDKYLNKDNTNFYKLTNNQWVSQGPIGPYYATTGQIQEITDAFNQLVEELNTKFKAIGDVLTDHETRITTNEGHIEVITEDLSARLDYDETMDILTGGE